MKSVIRAVKERLLVIPGIKIARKRPSRGLVAIVRWLSGIQTSSRQLLYIIEVVGKKAKKTPCQLVVFGLGNDTIFWSLLNEVGGDVFVHDCNREIEDIYCNEFLKPENMATEIQSSIGWLRYYGIEHE